MVSLPTVLLLALVAVVYVGGLVAFSYAITMDAKARGHPYPAALGALGALVAPVGLYFLFVLRWTGEREFPPTKGERVANFVVLVYLGSFLVATTVAPPDPFTQLLYAGGTAIFLGPLAYLVVFRNLWGRIRAEVR
jgi:hypothetical protein